MTLGKSLDLRVLVPHLGIRAPVSQGEHGEEGQQVLSPGSTAEHMHCAGGVTEGSSRCRRPAAFSIPIGLSSRVGAYLSGSGSHHPLPLPLPRSLCGSSPGKGMKIDLIFFFLSSINCQHSASEANKEYHINSSSVLSHIRMNHLPSFNWRTQVTTSGSAH